MRMEPVGDDVTPPSPGETGVNARCDVTSVRGTVGGGFDVDLAMAGAAGATDTAGGVMIGWLRRPSIVAARMRGLVGVGDATTGVTGEVGGTTENTNGRLLNGVTGADSVDDAGRAMRSTEGSASISPGDSVRVSALASDWAVKSAGSVAVDVALNAVTCI